MKRISHPATGQPSKDCQNNNSNNQPGRATKLFKLVASKGGQIAFDDRIEATTPREAREKMKAALGLRKLAGVVYSIN